MDATAFCSNHVWKRWFWPQKLSMNAPRFESAFWNAVYSKSAFWNAVYSKISMDATAFCSNHVWKRWFWPQKLSINAPIIIMYIFPTLIWGSPTPDRAVNSIEWADLRGCLTLDVKICTYNVKFGLFWVCSVTLRQFVWILVKSGWLLCICNSCGVKGLWAKVIWSRPLWMRGGEKFWWQSYVNLERFWNFYTLS